MDRSEHTPVQESSKTIKFKITIGNKKQPNAEHALPAFLYCILEIADRSCDKNILSPHLLKSPALYFRQVLTALE